LELKKPTNKRLSGISRVNPKRYFQAVYGSCKVSERQFFCHRCTRIEEDKNDDKKIIKKYLAFILFLFV
jgi:hypothetical protein